MKSTVKLSEQISELKAELQDLLELMCQFDEDAPEYRDLMNHRRPLLKKLRRLENR